MDGSWWNSVRIIVNLKTIWFIWSDFVKTKWNIKCDHNRKTEQYYVVSTCITNLKVEFVYNVLSYLS